jgi:hypothetical protein
MESDELEKGLFEDSEIDEDAYTDIIMLSLAMKTKRNR